MGGRSVYFPSTWHCTDQSDEGVTGIAQNLGPLEIERIDLTINPGRELAAYNYNLSKLSATYTMARNSSHKPCRIGAVIKRGCLSFKKGSRIKMAISNDSTGPSVRKSLICSPLKTCSRHAWQRKHGCGSITTNGRIARSAI